MLVAVVVRETVATLPSNCCWPGVLAVSGVALSASTESTLYCGVCTATRYWTPFCGASRKLGAVCPLDEGETRRARETLRWGSGCGEAKSEAVSTMNGG